MKDLTARTAKQKDVIPSRSLAALGKRLSALYDAGEVTRLHTVPMLRPHTIAEHVYGSLLIATELVTLNVRFAASKNLNISRVKVMEALLIHDAPEVVTGDAPAPVKRAHPAVDDAHAIMEDDFYNNHGIEFPHLNKLEEMIVKASDTLDLGFTIARERRMGNRHSILKEVYDNVMLYTLAQVDGIDGVTDMRVLLAKQWSEV